MLAEHPECQCKISTLCIISVGCVLQHNMVTTTSYSDYTVSFCFELFLCINQ